MEVVETPASSKIKYRNPLNDIPDQWLFFGFFAVGLAAICVLKYRGYSQFVVTAAPISLMAIYAAIALVTKRYRIREDRVGDNMYYLGFLYTLVSLAYALWSFTSDGSATETIITNFGVAIATTIIGLAGRVFFNQMREDPVEYEREARLSLADASRELKSQLDDVSIEMSSFKRKLMQIVEEGIVDISNKADETLQKNVTKFTEVNETVIHDIREAFSAFTDHSTKLNEIASKNVDALDQLFRRIEQIEASPDLIASKISPVIDKFAEVADEALKRNRAHNSELKKLRDMVESATTSIGELHNTVGETQADVADRLSELAKGVQANVSAAERLAAVLDTAADRVTSSLSHSEAATAEVRKLMDDAIRASAESVKGLGDATARELAALEQIASQVKTAIGADVEMVRQHRADTEAMLRESRAMTEDLEKSLVSLAHAIAEKVSGREYTAA